MLQADTARYLFLPGCVRIGKPTIPPIGRVIGAAPSPLLGVASAAQTAAQALLETRERNAMLHAQVSRSDSTFMLHSTA